MEPRIGIVVVAYNAASTLAKVLDRIPPAFVPRISDVLVSDDASDDSTFLVGLGYQQLSELPLTVIRQERNLGYGGNQKAAYRWAIEHGLDVVVLAPRRRSVRSRGAARTSWRRSSTASATRCSGRA